MDAPSLLGLVTSTLRVDAPSFKMILYLGADTSACPLRDHAPLRSAHAPRPQLGPTASGDSERAGWAGAHGGADLRPAPRAPEQNLRPAPRAPVRPRPNGRAGSSRSRSATHPAQISRIAGCAAHPARPGRRRAHRKFRDGLAAAASSGMAGTRSALCLPSCPSLSCLIAASCASKQLLLLAPITCCACSTMRSAQIIHHPTCHDTSIDITTF
jgi:hypothetical protein